MASRKRSDGEAASACPRPMPPRLLFDDPNWIRRIVPADGGAERVSETLMREGAPLHNEDHAHLVDADVAYLWAAVENIRQMRRVIAHCEEVTIRAGGWDIARRRRKRGAPFERFALRDMRPAAVTDRQQEGDDRIVDATGQADERMI
ncbi:hypothetical protein [Burkholderia multivorans]|nr:hypothetical protein [Burkholderia multivorans]ABX15351.1 hypothetical protein Bmul_1663 [Burkholderia multivorans ATCC 17616]KGC03470.1 hypothetical protein DM81_3603 [Burkholderia multivorans]MCO8626033.1 hypothetical protein [Burkholderia multivorans]